MAIASTDIQYRRSGAAFLGGAVSAVAAGTSLFDDVAGSERSAGHVDYRCVYIVNAHADLTLESAVAWIAANTPSTSTVIEIGLGTSAVGGVEQTIASETTAPVGVTFVTAASKASGVALGSIPAGQHRAVWLRRTTTAGATTRTGDTCTISAEGGSAP